MKILKPVLLMLSVIVMVSVMSSAAFAADLTVVGVSSEHKGQYDANLAVDGDDFTFWHTEYEPIASAPHWIVVDLGATATITGLTYLPRQDGYSGEENGNVAEYNIYASTDNKNWTKVASGTWDASLSTEQTATFDAAEARYVKFEKEKGDYLGVANLAIQTAEGTSSATSNPKTGDSGVLPYALLALMSSGIFLVMKKVRLGNK